MDENNLDSLKKYVDWMRTNGVQRLKVDGGVEIELVSPTWSLFQPLPTYPTYNPNTTNPVNPDIWYTTVDQKTK